MLLVKNGWVLTLGVDWKELGMCWFVRGRL